MDEGLSSSPHWIIIWHGDIARFSLRCLAIGGSDFTIKKQ